MNRKKILDFVERDFQTLGNLERSMRYALNSDKGRGYQYRILHSAFKRTCDIMLRRRKLIARELGLKLLNIQDPN
jgi:hypothetical protein